jgi:hypothetical protein
MKYDTRDLIKTPSSLTDLEWNSTMASNYLINLYEKANRLPAGKLLFSRLFARKAPYFSSISPVITELRPHFCEVRFKKRKAVENHIHTVHVIAIANALECAMGACTEASIPPNLRWIPKGMDLQYPAKASTDIRATAEIDPASWGPDKEVNVIVKAMRDDDTVVVEGVIHLWVTEKPKRSAS